MSSRQADATGGEPGDTTLPLVKRIASELTLLVPTHDEKLDQILQRLRRSLSRAEGKASVQDSANEFFQYMISGAAIKADGGLARIDAALRELAKDAQLDLFFTGAEARRNTAPDPRQVLDNILSAIRQLAPVIANMRHQLSVQSERQEETTEGETSQGTSWLGRMLGKSNQTSEDVLNVVQVIGPVLEDVIEHLQILDLYSERSRKIKALLFRADTLTAIQSVLESTLQLVIDIATDINAERGETELFLSGIKQKLSSLEAGVAGIVDVDASLKNADKIELELSRQVSDIGVAVSESENLDNLKLVVTSKIDVLTKKLTSYIENEKNLLTAARVRVGELSSQIQVMGSEIEQLQVQVNEKQVASFMDPLTGVANRGGFDQALVKEIARSRRVNYPLSLLFIDIDKFKEVNDRFGHVAGDAVIKTVAGIIKRRARETDVVARYGGDEFVLLLPNTGIAGATVVAQGMIEQVKKAGFHGSGKPVDVTISIGATELKEDDSAQSVIERADRALYLAKDHGRDGVEVAA